MIFNWTLQALCTRVCVICFLPPELFTHSLVGVVLLHSLSSLPKTNLRPKTVNGEKTRRDRNLVEIPAGAASPSSLTRQPARTSSPCWKPAFGNSL